MLPNLEQINEVLRFGVAIFVGVGIVGAIVLTAECFVIAVRKLWRL